MSNLDTSFLKLKEYCEREKYKGWDPYDGLNSKFFQTIPLLKKWDLARLVWIQSFKRSPINFRKITGVPKQHNAKGVALFLSGYCNLYKVAEKSDKFGTKEELKQHIIKVADLLLSMENKNYSGACWGYNFDWQARRLFLFPKNLPTVVATSFCVEALLKAYEITGNENYLNRCISATEFVIKDLNREKFKSGFLFSYSPMNGNNTVFNASLLGAKILSLVYSYTKDEHLKNTALQTVKACCDAQEKDGSWVYGMLSVQSWIDSFHTGYNLDAIQVYQNCTGDTQFSTNIIKGHQYYIENFFLSDGMPKYYHDRTYPIDIHCPGQLFVTLSKTGTFKEHHVLASKVLKWTLETMQDKKGYFYYQLKKGISSKISYMRWSNAFMFNALSYYLLEREN